MIPVGGREGERTVQTALKMLQKLLSDFVSFSLSDDQRQVQDIIRRVAADKVAPRAAAIDADAIYPQEMFDLLRDLGLFTLPFPNQYGGQVEGGGSML